ncbi:lysozyme 1-like, partial [Nilaparvata lugens]|uniref:lysozyme 1-like n=1 Tax=Nilaparvata lugens TaxID=108931 RepID=UPI00193EB88C
RGDLIIEPITNKCLTCICNGASRCGLEVKCDGDVCGVFSIGYEYWLDSNSPTLPFDSPESEGEDSLHLMMKQFIALENNAALFFT